MNTNAVSIASGAFHILALRDDGTVTAWGNNSSGEANVPSGLSNVIAITAGRFHSAALTSAGAVVTWGNTNLGQGNVPDSLTNVVAISSGASHILALLGDGPPSLRAFLANPKWSPNGFSV